MPKIVEIILAVIGIIALAGVALALLGWGILMTRLAIQLGAC